MPSVVYRGPVEDLQGSRWEVPGTVIQAGQAAAWIESEARQAAAEEAAAAEAAQRQQELLAARIEQQRLAAEAQAADPMPTREELAAEFRGQLDELSTSVVAAAAAIAGRGEAEAAARADWELRHEELISGAEAAITEAQAQVQAAQAVTQASTEQVQSELDQHRQTLSSLEAELRTTVAGLQGPQGFTGPTGLAGSGVTTCTESPEAVDPSSFGQRWFGRELVPGDSTLQITPNAVQVWRYTGNQWLQGPAIVPKQDLIDAKISALDNSTKQTTLVTNQNTTVGGGGGGTLPLLRREVTLGGGNNLIPIARGYDWDVPSQFWGGDPTSSDYDQASWNRKPATVHSFHVRFIALDTNDLNNIAQEAFTVTKHLNGVTDITVYEVSYQGLFNDPAFGGLVADAQIFDIQQDFTVESGGLVTNVTGKELRLSFGPNGLAGTRPVQLSGTITPLTLRRPSI